MWILKYDTSTGYENPEIHGVTNDSNIAAEWKAKGYGYYTTDVNHVTKCPDPYEVN